MNSTSACLDYNEANITISTCFCTFRKIIFQFSVCRSQEKKVFLRFPGPPRPESQIRDILFEKLYSLVSGEISGQIFLSHDNLLVSLPNPA